MIKDKIERVKLKDLKFYPDNPRKHDKKQIEQLANQIKIVGFNQPIIIDELNQVLVGNGRLEAADLLNFEELPCIRYDKLNNAQKKQLLIADNKLNDLSDWDNDTLGNWLNELNEANLESYFTTEEMTDIWDLPEETAKEDNFEPPNEAKYQVKRGDIYQLGEHRLMCGDSTEKSQVDALMGESKADMVFTDPPYNVNYSGGRQQLSKEKHNNAKIINDNMEEGKFTDFLNSVYERIDEATTKNSNVYVCHDDTKLGSLMIFLNCWDKIGWHHANEIIWQKNVASLGFCDYRYIHECISYGWKGKSHYNSKDMTEVDVWFEKKDHHGSYQHPTQKPIELSARAIKNSSKKEDIVLDLFGGSGSTLIACEQLNRKCYMMELDEYYCSVIIERWEKLTGKQHTKLN